MNISKKFKDIFYILSDDEESINLIDKLQELYNKNIINIEILLNIIKGLIFIFSQY